MLHEPRHDDGQDATTTAALRGETTDDGTTPAFVLRVTSGPAAGAARLLDWASGARVLIGKSATCDVQVPDAGVSRRHVALSRAGSMVRLTDLDSTNGTRVDGMLVTDVRLRGGETITIGESELRLVRTGMSAPEPARRGSFGRVLGRSFDMERVFELAARLAPTALPIIVEGETGTGKELLAEAIHEASPRAAGPFVVLDCVGVESDPAILFGGEQPGALEQASRGTLVLDNVDELPPDAQARLVTVLRDAAIARGGAWRPLDMRVVATSRRDLDREVQDGRFREDLLYRLAGARIDLPPLRARHGDVELLAEYFWKLHRGDGPLPKSVVLLLARQPLPGNVTELSHVIARRVALGHDAHPRAWMGAPLAARPRETRGPDVIDEIVAQRLSLPAARQRVIDEFERRYLVAALEDHGGNVTRAAATSGLTRRHFHSLLAKSRSSSRPPPLPEE